MSGSFVAYPGYADQPGLLTALGNAGITMISRPDSWYVSNLAAAQAIVASYTTANALVYLKGPNQDGNGKMDALNTYAAANFNLLTFIESGTANPVTGTQVAGFLASWTNNYRTLKTAIQSAPDATTLAAINILSGWPANP